MEECIEWSTDPGSLTLERDDAIESQISDYSNGGAVLAWDADNDGDQDICNLGGSVLSVRVLENRDNAQGWVEHLVLGEIGYLNDVETAELTDTKKDMQAGLHTFQYIIPETGIYFCRATTDGFNEVRSVLVME